MSSWNDATPSDLERELMPLIVEDCRDPKSLRHLSETHGIKTTTLQHWLKRAKERGELATIRFYGRPHWIEARTAHRMWPELLPATEKRKNVQLRTLPAPIIEVVNGIKITRQAAPPLPHELIRLQAGTKDTNHA